MLSVFKSKNHYLLYLLLLGLISLFVTFANLGFSKNFIGEDSGVAFDFPNALKDMTYYMWDSHRAPGKANISSVFNFVWNNFILLLSFLGFSGLIIKRLLYFLFFFLTGAGMFNLALFILQGYFKNNEGKFLFSAFIASLIYMFNPYTLQLASFPIINYHNSYIFFPWIFLLFIYNLNKSPSFTSVFVFSLLVVIAISANPSNTVIIFAYLFFYFIFFIKRYIYQWKQNIFFVTAALILIFLLSAFIVLPIINTETNIYGIEKIDVADFLGSIKLHSTFTSFINLYRLVGSREWPTFPYSQIYDNNLLFLILSFMIPITAVSAVLFNIARREKIFLILMVVVFIFAAKGIHDPLPEPFLYLVETFPLLSMFRAVYFKFMFPVVLSFSLLIAFALTEFQKIGKLNRYAKILKIVIILVVLINNFPFFFGLVPKKDYLNNIPKNYLELEQFFKHQVDGKVLSLPETPNGSGPIMDWKTSRYVGPPADLFFLDRPTFDGYWFISQKFFGLDNLGWDETKLAEKSNDLVKLAGIMNLKYFLIHKDYLQEYEFTTSNGRVVLNGPLKAEIINNNFRTSPYLNLVITTDNYDIYERTFLPDWQKIYIPENIVVTKDVKQQLSSVNNLDNTTFAVIKEGDINLPTTIQTNHRADLDYKENDPTSYDITIKNANYPLLLVFSETLHPQWQLKDKDGSVVPKTNHLLANNYANAWIVERGSNFKLEFLPQKYFNYGLIVSSLTLLLSLIILIYKSKLVKNKK